MYQCIYIDYVCFYQDAQSLRSLDVDECLAQSCIWVRGVQYSVEHPTCKYNYFSVLLELFCQSVRSRVPESGTELF